MGKGYALRQGVLEAANDYLLLTDAALSVSLLELEKFMPHLEAGHPIIIASRKLEGSRIIKAQPWYRQRMGEAYTNLANLILGTAISDFTCGFKIMERSQAQRIFSISKINRWSYDVEVLYLAQKSNLNVYEVSVSWSNDKSTKVKIIKDAVRSFIDLIRIKLKRYF